MGRRWPGHLPVFVRRKRLPHHLPLPPGAVPLPIRKAASGKSPWSEPNPGWTDDYLKGLTKTLKGALEEEKKQGLVLSYKILLGDAATPGDYNIINMVEFKDMAAFDNLREKTDPIFMKIAGGEQQLREGAIKRAEIRDIVGTKIMREITLK